MPTNLSTPATPAPIHLPLLASARIASPCPARWEDMHGDDKTRHCALCKLSVHNLAAMTSSEAEHVLAPALAGERVCARIWRRADGTILTRDCPVGFARVRANLRRATARAAAALGLAGLFAQAANIAAAQEGLSFTQFAPVRQLLDWFRPAPSPIMGKMMVMGDVCVTPPAPPTPPPPAPPVKEGE